MTNSSLDKKREEAQGYWNGLARQGQQILEERVAQIDQRDDERQIPEQRPTRRL